MEPAVGDRVECKGYTSKGFVRFIGETHVKKGKIFYGVELDDPVGKNNGIIEGIKYFGPIAEKCGVFLSKSKVTLDQDDEETPPPPPKKASKKPIVEDTVEMVVESPLDEDGEEERQVDAKRQEIEAEAARCAAEEEEARLRASKQKEEAEEAARLEGMSEWVDTFKLFDQDGSGDITHQELGTVLRQLGTHTTNQQAATMIQQYDKDNSGTITLDEFIAMMKANPMKEDVGREHLNAEGFPAAKVAQSEWIRICNEAADTGDSPSELKSLIEASKKTAAAKKKKLQEEAEQEEEERRRVQQEQLAAEDRKKRQEAEVAAEVERAQEKAKKAQEEQRRQTEEAAAQRATQQAEQERFVREKEGYEIDDRVNVEQLGSGTVMYVGLHKSIREFKDKIYGVDLDTAPTEEAIESAEFVGLLNHQGKFDRAFYFRCNDGCGVLVLQPQMSLKRSVQDKVKNVAIKPRPANSVMTKAEYCLLPAHMTTLSRGEARSLLQNKPFTTLIVYRMAAATSGFALLYIGRNGADESRKINKVSDGFTIGQASESFNTIEELTVQSTKRQLQALPSIMTLYDPVDYDNLDNDEFGGFDVEEFEGFSEVSEKQMKAMAITLEKKGEFLDCDGSVQDENGKPRPVWPPTCGDIVLVIGVGRGEVKYSGPLVGLNGDKFVGVHLDYPMGKTDGTYLGTSYFSCEDKRGIMVAATKKKVKIVSKGDPFLQENQPKPAPASFNAISEREEADRKARQQRDFEERQQAVKENKVFMSSFVDRDDEAREAEEAAQAALWKRQESVKRAAAAAEAKEQERKEAQRKRDEEARIAKEAEEQAATARAEKQAAEATQAAEAARVAEKAVAEKEAAKRASDEKEAAEKAAAAKHDAEQAEKAAKRTAEKKTTEAVATNNVGTEQEASGTAGETVASKRTEASAGDNTPKLPGTEKLRVGQQCDVDGTSKNGTAYGSGVIKFIGEHFKHPGQALIGVQLTSPNGRNAGRLPNGAGWDGCPDKHGVFVPPSKVKVL